MTDAAGPLPFPPRSAALTALRQAALLLLLAVVGGAARQFLPDGVRWAGRWPTADTSAEDAYKMMAHAGDPPFASIAEAIAMHNNGILFLDARSHEEYVAGHIPHARNLPYYEIDQYAAKALAGVKANDRLVVYCEGPGCELSLFLGRELLARGYTDIRDFYGGFPEWQKAGLEVEKGE